MEEKPTKLKTISVINRHCNRIVYFAVPVNYDYRSKSLEEIYKDSLFASFRKEETTHFAIGYNLKKL